MIRFYVVVVIAMCVLLGTSGCQTNEIGSSPEAVARQFVKGRVPANALDSLHVFEPIPWKQGYVVVYDIKLPAQDPIPAQDVAGYVVVEQQFAQWNIIGSNEVGVNKDLTGMQATRALHIVENDYALVFGQVPQTTMSLEVQFDTGEEQHVTPVDQIFVAIAANSRGVCEVHATTLEGAVEAVAIGPARSTSTSSTVEQIEPTCQ